MEKPNPDEETWGYDLYPERKGSILFPSFKDILRGKGQEKLDKVKCERNVYKCVKTSPLVRLMMGALKSSGCPVDIRRHISCEECDPSVTGGYDPQTNQIVICQNMASENMIQGILTHEMVHMFDYCRNDLDFKNLDHLICTEIRASNLTYCSFFTAWMEGTASFFNISKAHERCVRKKVFESVLTSRKYPASDIMAAIDRVFPICYKDLEPIGRRIRRQSYDMYRAYKEGSFYGYE